MTHRIQVTREHIRRGQPHCPRTCAIALATAEALAEPVEVGNSAITVGEAVYLTSQALGLWLYQFDTHQAELEPFTLVLNDGQATMEPASDIIRVAVTRDHIINGVEDDCERCAIALAMMAAGLSYPYVDEPIKFSDSGDLELEFNPDDNILGWMRQFDITAPVTPFTLVLHCADELATMETKPFGRG